MDHACREHEIAECEAFSVWRQRVVGSVLVSLAVFISGPEDEPFFDEMGPDLIEEGICFLLCQSSAVVSVGILEEFIDCIQPVASELFIFLQSLTVDLVLFFIECRKLGELVLLILDVSFECLLLLWGEYSLAGCKA